MINKGTAYIRVRDAEQINQVVRMIQQEICAYLDWAACPRVSLLAKERAVKLLREVKRTAEEAFESQDGSYAEVVLGRGHGRWDRDA